MKPIIGLTSAHHSEHQVTSIHYDRYEHLGTQYVEAVRRAGGVPLLMPPGDDWPDALQVVDGIIVTGGADVHPTHYNGDASHPSLTALVPQRDGPELALARTLAHDSDLPALFVCRGLQVLNVALGGTLHPHIPDIRAEDIHRNSDGGWAMHGIAVDADSALAQVMGTTAVETTSGHHQGIDQLGEGLRVVGRAPDDFIEAVELPTRPNLLAVQWHPEVTAATDTTQQALFDFVVQRAAERRAVRASAG